MNVVDDNTIFGSIRNAIMQSETNGISIERIELTPEEMNDLLSLKHAKQSADKHYASMLNEWAVHNTSTTETYNIGGKDVKLPSEAWVKYVKLVVIRNP